MTPTRNTPKPRKARGTSTPFGRRLQELTGPVFSVGTPTPGGGYPRMRNDTYLYRLATRGRQFTHAWKVSHYYIGRHHGGEVKLKVCAVHGGLTLLYLDFDTHKYGSLADLMILAQVCYQLFPGMPEFVFSDRGASGWLVVDTGGTTEAEYNALVDRLQAFLQSVARSFALDVEFVEAKGRVYEPGYDGSGRVTHLVRTGDLMKAPPAAEHLTQRPVDAAYLAGPQFDPWPDLSGAAEREADQPAGPRQTGGSFRPCLVTERMAGRLDRLAALVRNRFPERPRKAGPWAVSDRQFAELLLAICLLPRNMDGSNPAKRHRRFVEALHAAGVFESAWNHHRYKAVRDFLSRAGHIEWSDHTYRPGFNGQPGRACRWSASSGLAADALRAVGVRAECGGDTQEADHNTTHTTLIDSSVGVASSHRVPTRSDARLAWPKTLPAHKPRLTDYPLAA